MDGSGRLYNMGLALLFTLGIGMKNVTGTQINEVLPINGSNILIKG